MLIGYMRVSSVDDRQSVDLQRDALLAAGVDERHLYSDKASGARDDRSGLKTCLEYLKEGDTLIVWKLDRLGRSLANLLTIITDLKVRGVAFQSLTEQMDTTTPHGELLFSLFGALAQYERALTRERVMAGLAAAKRRGRRGGRFCPAGDRGQHGARRRRRDVCGSRSARLDGGGRRLRPARTLGLFHAMARAARQGDEQQPGDGLHGGQSVYQRSGLG